MSTEDDICLWCQDSLTQHGLVIELTTEDFKQMFKHDANCKIIHYACFKDYQKKRAKDEAENEQKRTTERPERPTRSLNARLWLRTLLAVQRTLSAVLRRRQGAETRLAVPAWPLAIPSLPYICELQFQISAPARTGFELYHPGLCVLPIRRAVVGPSIPEQYFRSNPVPIPRAHIRFQQPYEMQYIHPPSFPCQPLSQPLVQSDRGMPPVYNNRFTPDRRMPPVYNNRFAHDRGMSPVYHNRFVPSNHSQRYFHNNSTLMTENQVYIQEQPLSSRCLPRQLSQARMYSSYSVATHQRIAGYQSVYQERT